MRDLTTNELEHVYGAGSRGRKGRRRGRRSGSNSGRRSGSNSGRRSGASS